LETAFESTVGEIVNVSMKPDDLLYHQNARGAVDLDADKAAVIVDHTFEVTGKGIVDGDLTLGTRGEGEDGVVHR
jgi:selenocysteine-specific translation elongation factor